MRVGCLIVHLRYVLFARLLIFVPTSGQSEMLNNKKYYVKDAPEVSFEWSHLPRPQDFVYVLKS